MHILFAEDQEIGRFFLASHLRQMGHTVSEAVDGLQALEILRRNLASPDEERIGMLITDWDMPNMNGLDLARSVRVLQKEHYIYTILLTGKGDAYDRVKGFAEGGVDDYVVKPFEINEVKLRVQVGTRLMEAEYALKDYTANLESIVARQTQAIRDAQNEIISRLFNALQSRHAETGAHVRRIGALSAFMGERLSWPRDRINHIGAAAPLHDIGKIGISDTILLKPGPLTADERIVMETHASIGGQILSNSGSPMIRMAELIARCHHENWDGTGYPDRLVGEEIPVEARIVSIVDVYDALRSNRVYRAGMSEDSVLEIMRRDRSRKFDPNLFDLFMDSLPDVRVLLDDPEFRDTPHDESCHLC
ncbi:response regulator [Phaeovibrio sulfidiphilus]|uniref:Response regulator n=1 Tax=Phaeovibrio sulfidiphilus TaxID=1220600 RepID=A0A8J7CQ30_9PROT|nr:HD domain-containing phosphohydrolase [Phaeovibrio sulfidiphilus]MBE1237787.1 response regulator [Phaeovibrio sulfidiphilus]